MPYNNLERNRQDAFEIYSGNKLPDGSYEKIWVGGYQEGYEPNVLYMYKAEGIYKSKDEIPTNLVDKHLGDKTLYGTGVWDNLSANEQNGTSNLPIQPGDVKWKDVNGDGVIDQYDRVKVGNTDPHWTGGFNTTLRWKGLQLYARFDFALDFWIMRTLPKVKHLGIWAVCKVPTMYRPNYTTTHGRKTIPMQNIRVSFGQTS